MSPRLLALALGVAACVPRVEKGPVPVELAREPAHLEVLDAPEAPTVSFQATIHAGSARDPVGQEGLAWLTAQALIDAGAGDRTAAAVQDALYPTGGGFDLVVDRDLVTLRLTCHRDQAELCLDLFADALFEPRFDAADVARMRDDALYEVTEGLLADQEALGRELLEAVLFEAHPYGHPTEGRAGVLELLDADAARNFYQRHYVRESVVAGVAGAVTDALRTSLRERLDALPGKRSPESVLPAPMKGQGRDLYVVQTPMASTGFHLGHTLDVDRAHPDFAALTLAMAVFGAHRQSHGRLYEQIRTRRGLNYGDYAYVEPFRERGWSSDPEQGTVRRQSMFWIWLRPTSLENGPFALKLALDELDHLVEDGLTDAEVERGRKYLLGHLPLEAATPARRLAYTLESLATGQPDPLTDLPARIAALDTATVNAAIARHLHPDRLRIVAVTGDADDLVHRLVEESATPIVYSDAPAGPEQAERDQRVAAIALGVEPGSVHTLTAEGIFR